MWLKQGEELKQTSTQHPYTCLLPPHPTKQGLLCFENGGVPFNSAATQQRERERERETSTLYLDPYYGYNDYILLLFIFIIIIFIIIRL